MVQHERWTRERAWDWYEQRRWLVGCNFIPSSASNQLEMWQAETFDPDTIDRELGWAAAIGFNTARVYLHDVAWEVDSTGFKQRMDRFLTIAQAHGITPMLVIFDDCWNPDPRPGPQPEPIPGTHNSRWLQSPGHILANDPASWPRLERYVLDVVGAFAGDERILAWDLYNEPGGGGQDTKSLPLLEQTFRWCHSANPTQPLTAGVWYQNDELNAFQLSASDIITFHNYGELPVLQTQIAELKQHGRPIICTEWMARPGSMVASHLPVFHAEGVGCINWGLVSGKTQTIYRWAQPLPGVEPDPWFHDLFRPDGTPYNQAEVDLFRELTGSVGA